MIQPRGLYWTDHASRAFISRHLTPQPKIVKRLVQFVGFRFMIRDRTLFFSATIRPLSNSAFVGSAGNKPGTSRQTRQNPRHQAARIARKSCGGKGPGNVTVRKPVCFHTYACNLMATRVECDSDSGIRCPQKWKPFLHRTQPRGREVLPRTRRRAEPCVVGHVDHPVRAVRLVDDLAGKDRLVANQRSDRRHPGNPQGLADPDRDAKPPPGTSWMPTWAQLG